MRLLELAYCCRLYGELTGYDASIDEMRRATRDGVDLHDELHTKALLRWLNHWGCRQFAVEYHGEAGRMLGLWADRWLEKLPHEQAAVGALDFAALEDVADAYADLKDRQASLRKLRGDRVSMVTVGPTGAAKILHALRPRALPPWDDPIRAALRYGLAVEEEVHGFARGAARAADGDRLAGVGLLFARRRRVSHAAA